MTTELKKCVVENYVPEYSCLVKNKVLQAVNWSKTPDSGFEECHDVLFQR